MWYVIAGLIGLVVGAVISGGLVYWFGVHKKQIPDIPKVEIK